MWCVRPATTTHSRRHDAPQRDHRHDALARSTALACVRAQDAIVWMSYAGEQGGVALANTIFGANAPAGRLVQTIYPAAYVDAVSMFEMNMPAGASVWPPFSSPGRTYRFYTGTPVFSFGEGLSYTTWSYALHQAPQALPLAETRAYLANNT